MTARPVIELVYDPDCPNVDRARVAIREALTKSGSPAVWREWRRDDPATPAPLARLGSPSVVVNGRDVWNDEKESAAANANSCRVYVDECGRLAGAPSAQLILDAISQAQAP